MKPFGKKTAAVLGAAVAATLSAGVATAVWNSPDGGGSGSAEGYQSAAASVTAAGDNTSPLYPGATGVTATVTVSNPNPYPVRVTSITNGNTEDGTGNAAAGDCDAATVNVVSRGATETGLFQSDGTTIAIPANNGTVDGTGTYTVTVTMATDADTACQGLDFTLPVTIVSRSHNF